MGYFRSSLKQSGGGDYSATYTATVNGVLQKGSLEYKYAFRTTFNEPVVIGNNTSSAYRMFENCTSFNSNVVIPNSVVNSSGMFLYCANLNQNIQIPNSIENCSHMFYGCTSLKQDIVIPSSVVNCRVMFSNCISIEKIYIKGKTYRDINIQYMLMNCSNDIKKNVYFNSVLNNIFNQNTTKSLVGTAITWTAMDNGFYNTAYNIYCYNNYEG